jgi:hypothetical protein
MTKCRARPQNSRKGMENVIMLISLYIRCLKYQVLDKNIEYRRLRKGRNMRLGETA